MKPSTLSLFSPIICHIKVYNKDAEASWSTAKVPAYARLHQFSIIYCTKGPSCDALWITQLDQALALSWQFAPVVSNSQKERGALSYLGQSLLVTLKQASP